MMRIVCFILFFVPAVFEAQSNYCVDWVEYELNQNNSISKELNKLRQLCYKNGQLSKKTTFRRRNEKEWVDNVVLYNRFGTDSIYIVTKFNDESVKTIFYRDDRGNIIRTLTAENIGSKVDTTEFIYRNYFNSDLKLLVSKTSLKGDSIPVNVFRYQYNQAGQLVSTRTETIIDGVRKLIEDESSMHDEKGNIIIKFRKDEISNTSEEWKFQYRGNDVMKESYYRSGELEYISDYFYKDGKMDYLIKSFPKQNIKRMIKFLYK